MEKAGGQPAEWTEGVVLPPFSPIAMDPDRAVFTVEARENDPAAPLTRATIMMVKGRYKLMYFFGYKELGVGHERIELYDVIADREELNNLYAQLPEVGTAMLNELKSKLVEKDLPYILPK